MVSFVKQSILRPSIEKRPHPVMTPPPPPQPIEYYLKAMIPFPTYLPNPAGPRATEIRTRPSWWPFQRPVVDRLSSVIHIHTFQHGIMETER